MPKWSYAHHICTLKALGGSLKGKSAAEKPAIRLQMVELQQSQANIKVGNFPPALKGLLDSPQYKDFKNHCLGSVAEAKESVEDFSLMTST